LLVAAGSPGFDAVALADTVLKPAIGHLGRLKVTASRASSCLHCPGPGDENVGPLALASINLPALATDHADHPGVATIPTMGLKARGPLPWRTAIHPWPGTVIVTLWRLVALLTAPTG